MSHAFSIGNFGYGLNAYEMFRYDPNQNIWTSELSPHQYFNTPSNIFSVNGRGFVIFGNGEMLEYGPSF
ncbi:MAG: hypothetical protein OEV74_08930 [Cyclobacteriaceae bacterium]|nr:hypothetical protein [Cyclobacteriaceae bacterium]MDH4296389.1 hypothetical protein [Cyclobacteriaceae bacterium]MDH5251648.1 hypothetical protein [Cyclobacteriaceae bacterium]